MSEIVHRVLGEFAILHYNRQVNLEARGNLWGQWDGARLGQVISNLVGNAIVYGDTEQPIGVKLEGRIDDVALTVQNFGQVIPKSEINMIFSPMTQVKNGEALQKGARGAGLGLYIACEITAAHGGEIDVESTKERGTIFKVTLPRSG